MTSASSPTLLVLAAGMGSRYGGLKQIDPVGPAGETIIDYSIFDALRAGFGKLVFIIRKDIEAAFRETVGARFEKRVAVDYVFQSLEDIPPRFTVPAGRTKPWGTTQAILLAAERIHEPFAAINADDFYGAESYRELARHLTSGSPDYAMVGFILRNTLSDFGSVARGVCQVSGDGYPPAHRRAHKGRARRQRRPQHRSRRHGDETLRRRARLDEYVGIHAPRLRSIARRASNNFLSKAVRPQGRMLHSQYRRRTGASWRGPCQSPALARFLVRRHLSRRPSARRRERAPPHSKRAVP